MVDWPYHEYWCQVGEKTVAVFSRKTKPRIGAVVTFDRQKWQVWYVEEQNGRCRAMLEQYPERLK